MTALGRPPANKKGKTYGRVTVIRRATSWERTHIKSGAAWYCRCDCYEGGPRYKVIRASSLNDDGTGTRSCGRHKCRMNPLP